MWLKWFKNRTKLRKNEQNAKEMTTFSLETGKNYLKNV